MREGKIVLPTRDNRGRKLTAEGLALARELGETFGGCTVLVGAGAWVDDGELQEEPVAVYHVGAEDTRENNTALKIITLKYGRMCRQKAVYYVDFDGEAHLDYLD